MPEDSPTKPTRQDRRSLRPNTTELLGRAHLALGRRIVDGVVSAGFPQRPAHSAVFANIDIEGGTRLSTLAARANITPQALSELVDDLERMGYVTRRPDPDDRRAKRIVLTERGHACVQAALGTISAIEDDLAALLGRQGLARLQQALRRVAETSADVP